MIWKSDLLETCNHSQIWHWVYSSQFLSLHSKSGESTDWSGAAVVRSSAGERCGDTSGSDFLTTQPKAPHQTLVISLCSDYVTVKFDKTGSMMWRITSQARSILCKLQVRHETNNSLKGRNKNSPFFFQCVSTECDAQTNERTSYGLSNLLTRVEWWKTKQTDDAVCSVFHQRLTCMCTFANSHLRDVCVRVCARARVCFIAREAAMWELEERHLQEKHQQLKQQLKDQYFLQRHQLLKRHEKVREIHSEGLKSLI